jgi:acyl-CoA thioesterase
VLDHDESHGTPLSIAVNFCAAIREGTFELRVELLRRNRSTSFWFVRFIQEQDGADVHCADATVVLADRRVTPPFRIIERPEAPGPEDLEPFDFGKRRAAWMSAFDIRFVSGDPFAGGARGARTVAWTRDRIDRALDFRSLLAMTDCAMPQIFHCVGRFIPISTVSMTVYFHATAAEVAAVGTDFVLYDATMRNASEGYFDETSHVWSRTGALLATMEQIVWYKVPES